MNLVRDAIVQTLRDRFPALGTSVRAFTGLLDEQSDGQISYPSPGVLVSAINAIEPPEEIAPWELRLNFGLVITAKAASAAERDKEGWQLCMRVAKVAYRNTWGVNPFNIRPAILVGIQKNTARDLNGAPTGVDYWTIQLYNWAKFDALIG